MKYMFGILLITSLFITGESDAQIKCYRFSLSAQSPDWRDSSCVACTSDPAVISEVNRQLSLPFAQRDKHINGGIAGGSASINKNAHHNFLWHFKWNDWRLAEMSMEVCDGRPYSDVDLDTAYWLNTVRFFCPWSSVVAEELTSVNINDAQGVHTGIALYPNPAVQYLNIVSAKGFSGYIEIYNTTGSLVYKEPTKIDKGGTASLDISQLPGGVYMLLMKSNYTSFYQRLHIAR